ncbi:MAG: response regulator [Candidatus Brocadiales bacterium]|nr:response regulator [Candidatus Bathyanammoxibius amoris]
MEKKSNTKILVVDDETLIAMGLESCLTSLGYEVVGTASSGEEAISMARELRPDLLLTDIVMPGKIDGVEAAKIIKAELNIPVIFVTAHEDKALRRAKEAEPIGYLLKPFSLGEVRTKLKDLISGTRGTEI